MVKTKYYFIAICLTLISTLYSAKLLAQTSDSTLDIKRITFADKDFPKSLYNIFTGNDETPYLEYRLPDNYSKDKTYPLILYVPGYHGSAGGNIQNAIDIAGSNQCIVASLPLFKKDVNTAEVGNGVIVSFNDYEILSKAYHTMLGKLFEEVPNIQFEKSTMAGFSNGAITTAILVSMHDEFILNHFQNFCIVDHGWFHLSDLHKYPTCERRFLIFVGDQPDYGRDLKLRGAKLAQDAWQFLDINLESRILKNTGHQLTTDCKKQIREWIFPKPKIETEQ